MILPVLKNGSDILWTNINGLTKKISTENNISKQNTDKHFCTNDRRKYMLAHKK